MGSYAIFQRIYNATDLPDYTESPEPKISPDHRETRNEARLIASSSKVIYVSDSEAARVLSSKKRQASPGNKEGFSPARISKF